ncbi:aldo/keto reductase [Nocardia harenae]|uniref:aldo/keto reductase n=1 Tax=Nocardia harenae TaxID=358707 RepID=UPI0008321953|nr:aldo/keto reductase [Nocardia harenae]
MDYVRLGRSGLQVSRLALGCMSYGDASRGGYQWVLDEEASRPFLRRAIELGINFFDTANAYSGGSGEEILGRALADFARRDEVVIATKAFIPWREGPNGGGLSRKALMTAIDDSLRRLAVDYIDLYQIHRWDPHTPIEETMEALHDLVKAGKVRYLGASSMYAWQFAKAQYTADLNGLTRFVSMQDHYNLLNREEEREMIPFCRDQGVAILPWSPLARGRLTRDPGADSARSSSDLMMGRLYEKTEEADRAVVERVAEVAEKRGVPRAQVALAWLAGAPGVTAPIVGATKPHHLEDAVAALELELDDEERRLLEEPYIPHGIVGF